MAMHTKDKWKLWNEERERFKNCDTMGFIKDLAALKTHIMKLQEYAPKDKANWPAAEALLIIDSLQKDSNRFNRYLDQLR